jgi:DNA-binding NarL/FixJ family response regulator
MSDGEGRSASPQQPPRGGRGRRDERTAPSAPLEDDQVALLRLLAQGVPVDVIGRRLDLSGRTVRRRCRAICDRLGVGTTVEAVVWAARKGII